MKIELSEEDKKRGIRNPYFSLSNKLVQVPISNEDYELFVQIAKENGGRPELVMRRCLEDCAKDLRAFED